MKTDRIYSINELAYLFHENGLKQNELCPVKEAYKLEKVQVEAGEEGKSLAAAFFAPHNCARLCLLSRSFWYTQKTVLTGGDGCHLEMTESGGRLYFSACKKSAEEFYADHLLSPGVPVKKCLSIKLSRDGLMMLMAYLDALKKARMKAKLAHAETPETVGAPEMIAEVGEAARFFDVRFLLPFVQNGSEVRAVDLNLGIQNLKDAGLFEPSFEIRLTPFGRELAGELSIMTEALFISSLYFENKAHMRDDTLFFRGRESLWCLELCETGKVLMRTLSSEETKEMLLALFEPGDEVPEIALPSLCKACGKPLLPGAAFCMECGAKADVTAGAAGKETQPAEKPEGRAIPAEAKMPEAPDIKAAEGTEAGKAEEPVTGDEPEERAIPAEAKMPEAAEITLSSLCKACGKPLLPGAVFCMECGAKADVTAGAAAGRMAGTAKEPEAPEIKMPEGAEAGKAEVPVTGDEPEERAIPAEMKMPEGAETGKAEAAEIALPSLCKACGKPLLPGAAFCMECGAKADAAVTGEAAEKDDASKAETLKTGQAEVSGAEGPVAVKEAVAREAARQIPEGGSEALLETAQGKKRCQKCGTELIPGAAFCMECGAKIESASEASAPKRCANCGTELIPGAAFCMECGAKIK